MKKIITNEQKAKIISLSEQGYNNRQIEIELGMKSATLQYWKKQIRLSGINIKSHLGRPIKGSKRARHTIGTIEEMRKQDIDI